MEEFRISLVSDDFKAGSSSAAKESGSLLGLGAKIGGAFLAIQALAEVVQPAIDSLLKPIKSILTGIFRVIGEFFRPITEIVVALLRPILILLKPLLDLFKLFMAPFISLARGFQAVAQQQMASGDIAGAMQTSAEAVGVILGPFIVSITSIALQLFFSIFVQTFATLWNATLGPLLGLIIGPDTISELTGAINGVISEITMAVLGDMKTDAETMLDELNASIGTKMDLLVETPLGALSEMKSDMDNFFGDKGDSIPTMWGTGLGKMKTAMTDFTSHVMSQAEKLNAPKEQRLKNFYGQISGNSLIIGGVKIPT